MWNANDHKNFTACGDKDAEKLLHGLLRELGEALAGTGLCVVLGGSYGRGDGGVRQDRENGILYNDLDFFIFARKKSAGAASVLKKFAEKYEKELHVDIDFSKVMTVREIRKNSRRLMMQELKRGYRPVCGEDLPARFLPELPAAELPFSEACRLLLNRGMGLLLAGAKIAGKSPDTDFILRNIYKAVLGAGDAILIASAQYRWQLTERLELLEKMDIPESWRQLYREAVDFKRAPHRQQKADMAAFWSSVRDFFQAAIVRCAGSRDLRPGLRSRCRESGEISLKNYIKYCIKNRDLPLRDWKFYTIPAVAVLLDRVYPALNQMPDKIDEQSKLYRQWLIFN